MPGASRLREKLRFEAREAKADDGYGNREDVWSEQFVSSARVQPLKGSETVIASRLAGVQPAIISIRSGRCAKQVAPGWRAVDCRSGAIYNIRSLANFDERNRMIEMTAEGGVPT